MTRWSQHRSRNASKGIGGWPVPQYEDTKSRLLRVALDLFQAKGYPAVTVQDIVEAMGATKGAFYYYLDSKEDLLYQIHDEFISYELQKAEEVVVTDLPARHKLRRIVTDLLESIARYKAHVTVFFRDWQYLSDGNLRKIKEKRDRYEALVNQVIREGVETGEFRQDIDPKIAGFALFGMCNWTYQWFKPDGRLRHDDVAATFELIFLEGFLAPMEAKGGERSGSSGPV